MRIASLWQVDQALRIAARRIHLPRTVLGRALHSLPIPPHFPSLENASQSREANAWIEKFKTHEVPKSAVEMTYSRSSGPGGQVRVL